MTPRHAATPTQLALHEARLARRARMMPQPDPLVRYGTVVDTWSEMFALADGIEAPRPRGPLTMAAILGVVANLSTISERVMKSARRTHAVVNARHVAVFLACEMTSASLPQIGRFMGGRDHTTIMHARRRIAEIMAGNDPQHDYVRELVERARAEIKRGWPEPAEDDESAGTP